MNILVPDPVPLVDELILGLILTLIGTRRKKSGGANGKDGRVIDGEIVDGNEKR